LRKWPVGWEALDQWGGDVARIERLAGGVANDVWSVRVNGQLAVARRGVRSDADLAWETELLVRLDRARLSVPAPIPTTDGRLFADGVVVMTYVEGGPPETEADWRRVADTLRQLQPYHSLCCEYNWHEYLQQQYLRVGTREGSPRCSSSHHSAVQQS
jgi:hypothetical protein